MRSNSTPPTGSKPPLTFGVELEFIITAHTHTPDPLRRISRPPHLITNSGYNAFEPDESDPWGPGTSNWKMLPEIAFELTGEMRNQDVHVRRNSCGWDAEVVQASAEMQEWGDTVAYVYHDEETQVQVQDPEDEWAVAEPRDHNGWVVKWDSSIVHPNARIETVRRAGSYTTYEGDAALTLNYEQLEEAGVATQGVEVVSKILTAGEDSFEEVVKVVNIMDGTFRTEVNRSYGLHVHVGNGREGFDLDTLKNLVGALWVFDREIIRLHPRYRTNLRRFNNPCAPLCGGALGRWPKKGDLKKTLKEIFGIHNLYELKRVVGDSKYQAYNFNNLPAGCALDPEECKETIEFRQHEATLDSGRVERWARFYARIVEWAKDSSRESMKHFLLLELERQQSGKRFKLWEFVDLTLGLPDVAKAFKTFILEKEELKASKRLREQQEKVLAGLSTMAFKEAASGVKELSWGAVSIPPNDMNNFDSDDESEYEEELAYYGKKFSSRMEDKSEQEERKAKLSG